MFTQRCKKLEFTKSCTERQMRYVVRYKTTDAIVARYFTTDALVLYVRKNYFIISPPALTPVIMCNSSRKYLFKI